ncbi:hypothetical protein A8F94_09865 [Bacillus sp. FJAT-27225]|uniref:hypothetical protein n=1 Tax=Bacillus sp. FJAT-27225 TaxID=1743144 RepID=UPI00080C2461|nr:hypothetical protein [Bacillus sp. FJAT-27225]OCA88116.1 hypothetical protein A8F94_09865 [Bacillus sp. FJAT-27225]
MKRNTFLITITLLAAFFAYNYFSIEQTTYGDVVSNLLKDNETVIRVEISKTSYNDNAVTSRKTAIISNEDSINRLLKEPVDMELKTHDRNPAIVYWLTFYTDVEEIKGFDIIMDNELALIGKEQYRISGNNKLAETIENLHIDWETH